MSKKEWKAIRKQARIDAGLEGFQELWERWEGSAAPQETLDELRAILETVNPNANQVIFEKQGAKGTYSVSIKQGSVTPCFVRDDYAPRTDFEVKTGALYIACISEIQCPADAARAVRDHCSKHGVSLNFDEFKLFCRHVADAARVMVPTMNDIRHQYSLINV